MGPLIAAIILRFAIIPTKAFAVETNLTDQTELCIKDSKHAVKIEDSQTSKTLEEEGKNSKILTKEQNKVFKEKRIMHLNMIYPVLMSNMLLSACPFYGIFVTMSMNLLIRET